MLWLLPLAFIAPPITLDSLLHEMVDRENLARLPSPAYTCLQASSYDRKSTAPDKDWFANGDANQFIRTETNGGGNRKEWVMMDAAGPGAISRIWSANPRGTIRIYLDNSPTPAVESPMADFLGGKWKAPAILSYEASKGWNSYLPIPYAKHCKVTSDADGFYYHVNYRTYPNNTEVRSFTAAALEEASPTLLDISKQLSEDRTSDPPTFGPNERGVVQTGTAAPGQAVTLTLSPGENAVTGMMLTLKGGDPAQNTRSCIIEATFDDEQTVWCPVGDFFGSGVGLNAYQDFYRAVGKDGAMRSRWVMPYHKAASITIRNLGKQPVDVDLRARLKTWEWNDRSMHFHAAWRFEYPIHAYGGKGTSDFNYVDITGRGVYIGDTLSVMNPVKDWWGEGDEKIYVDGEKFPSHFGTGTEDYYGYAWCWPAYFTRPFHAQSRVDGQACKPPNNWGRTTVSRTRALDAIPFTKSLSMNIEVWHWHECDIEYASTAYFYATPGATTNRKPNPEAAARALIEPPPLPPPRRIKDSIEAESLKVTAKSDGTAAEPQDGFPGKWSNEEQLWVRAKAKGDFVELKVPASAGKHRVKVYATKSWDYGIVHFSVNGQKAGADVDLYSGKHEVIPTGPIDLGVFEPKDGSLLLRCELVGGNEKSEGTRSFFGLDCIVLEPVKE